MPLPHSRAHRLFLLRIKCSIIHLDMLSVYPNLDDFNRPVQGAMKLLRACFRNFQCIFHLARLNNCNWLKKNHCGIKICIWYVLQYFEEFINFVEGCGSYELLAVPDSRIGPWTTFGSQTTVAISSLHILSI